jgi:hypothetical protein
MTDKEKKYREAVSFSAGPRGQYIIARALFTALKAMKQLRPLEQGDVSDIRDMKYILENVYPAYSQLLYKVDYLRSLKG